MKYETNRSYPVDLLSLERIYQKTTPILYEKVERAKDNITKHPNVPYSNDVNPNEVRAAYFAAENILNNAPGLLEIVL
jgi:hypothetical protein